MPQPFGLNEEMCCSTNMAHHRSPGFDLRIVLDHVSQADHVLAGVMEQEAEQAADVKMCHTHSVCAPQTNSL